MARICEGCNKFASIDDSADCEVEDYSLEAGILTFDVTVPLMSQCCGEEMASQTLSGEIDVTDAHDASCTAEAPECEHCGGTGVVDVEGVEDECDECGGSGEAPWEDEQASGGERYEIDDEPTAEFLVDMDPAAKVNPKTGKVKVVPYRYRRTYYGASVTASVVCRRCDETFEVTGEVKDMASSF